MFEHVTLLLSVIFALAMTQILMSATELVWEREKVRFYPLHAVWMVNALLCLLAYWLSIWELSDVKHWTGFQVALQFVPAIVQYFACSLLSMKREGDGIMDMKAFYERQRPFIFSAFALMWLISVIQIFADRNNPPGSGWIGTELPILLILAATLIAGWAKPLWLQWTAGLFVFGLEAIFVVTYAARP